MPQLAGRSDVENPAVQAAVEGDGGVAQGTIGDRDRQTSYLVVHDLMPDENLPGIASHLAVMLEENDGLAVA